MPNQISLCYNLSMPVGSKRIRPLAILFISLFLFQPALAQAGPVAVLSNLNTQSFPSIEAYLDVYDSSGEFVSDLKPAQVTIYEDGKPTDLTSLQLMRQGVQFVTVFNPGPSFGVRDSKGKSRYDFLKGALEQWAKGRQGSNLDDLSLLITNGPSISHTSDSLKFATALQSENINAREAVPNLDILYNAVKVASDPAPRPGMKRVVLFITPPLDGQDISLDNLVTQAREQGVSIYVWMVTTKGTFSSLGVQRLNDLASKTGGWVFTYTGDETLPNPEDYLAKQRNIYHLAYPSGVNSNGTHQVIAKITLPEDIVETEPQTFEILLLPPVPAFISPPIQIQRKPPVDAASSQQGDIVTTGLIPPEQPLQIIFDFPDGRKRPIIKTALLVDGVSVAENTTPPFDQFSWNLQKYTTDGSHLLKIEATDAFGLTGTSIEIPVSINIIQATPNPWSTIAHNLPALVALAVLLSIAILILVLITGGQLKPITHRPYRRGRRKIGAVTQAVQTQTNETVPETISHWVSRLHWPQHNGAQNALAYLRPVDESGEQPTNPPIAISQDEITIGRDPNLATLVLNDPSIDGLHARLIRQEDSSYFLKDEGSIAGTWINYSPIPQEGAKLEHGDLVNFGRICFRFNLKQPGNVRKPVITPGAIEEKFIEEII
jgi:hypothetical protein